MVAPEDGNSKKTLENRGNSVRQGFKNSSLTSYESSFSGFVNLVVQIDGCLDLTIEPVAVSR